MVPVSQVLRENIRRQPWKLGQPHVPISWREETDGNLREGKVKVERRRTLKLSYLSSVFMWGRKGRQDLCGRPQYGSLVKTFLNSDIYMRREEGAAS